MKQQRIYVALDLETTGFDPKRRGIIEIGAVKFQGNQILDRFETLVNPNQSIPIAIQQLTGISDEDVAEAPFFREILPEIRAFVDQRVAGVIAHNVAFDLGFLRAAGLTFPQPALDTVELAHVLLPNQASYNLGQLCSSLNIHLDNAHRALADAEATAHLFMYLHGYLAQLPRPVLDTILHYGTHRRSPSLFPMEVTEPNQWPLLHLFQEAAHVHDPTQFATSASPHRSIHGCSAQEELVHSNRTPIEIDGLALIDSVLGKDGILAQQMGDAFEMRTGQVEMAKQVWNAFANDEHLIIEAETGTGKTLAYLVGAALWALKSNERIAIATNTRTLQDQLIGKDIPCLNRLLLEALPTAGSTINSVVLKGRNNYLCVSRLVDWIHSRLTTNGHLSPHELRLLAKILVWLPTTMSGDLAELMVVGDEERQILGQICSDPTVCHRIRCASISGPLADFWHWLPNSERDIEISATSPDYYLRAHEHATDAHLIIINHTLLLADISSGEQLLPTYSRLIIDEGHRLDEAATEQLTYQVDLVRVRHLLLQLAPNSKLFDEVTAIASPSLRQRIHTPCNQIQKSLPQLLEDWHALLQCLQDLIDQSANIQPHNNYSQRLRLERGVRGQPIWARIEIVWENLSLRLTKILEYGSQVLRHLKSASWLTQQPHDILCRRLSGTISKLELFHEQVDQVILRSACQGDGTVAWLENSKLASSPKFNRRASHDFQTRSGSQAGKDPSASVKLNIAPIWVNHLLNEMLVQKKQSLILTGATLRVANIDSHHSKSSRIGKDAGFGYMQELLGMWHLPTATIESPLNYKQNVLLIMPQELPPPNDTNYQSAVEKAIIAAASASRRTLVLFTNYAQVKATAKTLRNHFHNRGVTILEHGRNGRLRLLNEFRTVERAVLLGTRSFWEGIDLPGDAVETLVIVRLPFSVPNNPLLAARSEVVALANETPFEAIQLPEAVIKFRQGFGRLIRRQSDRGAVLLLDSRIWQKPYGLAFLNSLPSCTEAKVSINCIEEEIERWLK